MSVDRKRRALAATVALAPLSLLAQAAREIVDAAGRRIAAAELPPAAVPEDDAHRPARTRVS